MTIETEIAALTTATTDLLSAVNVTKATLDTKKDEAVASAAAALASEGIATTKASDANTSAVAADASAALAAA
jgi:hypothetical protein